MYIDIDIDINIRFGSRMCSIMTSHGKCTEKD